LFLQVSTFKPVLIWLNHGLITCK